MFDRQKVSSLSKEEQKILVNQIIDERRPGSILVNFETLLDFIGEKDLQVTGKYNLLPMNKLSHLNAKLQHPLEVRLQRPQQKSYPNINGLYLLLRSTGLVYIKVDGKKQLLMLDEAALKFWQPLNPTERYFTLLEVWFIHSSVEILGDHRDRLGPLYKCIEFIQQIPDNGLKIAGNKEMEQQIAYYPGLLNLALLEMFGLIVLEHSRTQAGKGWMIAGAKRVPLGNALLKYLYQIMFVKHDLLDLIRQNAGCTEADFGKLQSSLRPFFPEWRNNLVLPKHEYQDGAFIFKASIGKVWRQIAISGNDTLDDLSNIILKAFKFGDTDHLYRFIYTDRFGRTVSVNNPYTEEPPFTSDFRIGDLPLQLGARMIYHFDFGDDWRFDLLLERIDTVDQTIKDPTVIESHGKAPSQYDGWDDEED